MLFTKYGFLAILIINILYAHIEINPAVALENRSSIEISVPNDYPSIKDALLTLGIYTRSKLILEINNTKTMESFSAQIYSSLIIKGIGSSAVLPLYSNGDVSNDIIIKFLGLNPFFRVENLLLHGLDLYIINASSIFIINSTISNTDLTIPSTHTAYILIRASNIESSIIHLGINQNANIYIIDSKIKRFIIDIPGHTGFLITVNIMNSYIEEASIPAGRLHVVNSEIAYSNIRTSTSASIDNSYINGSDLVLVLSKESKIVETYFRYSTITFLGAEENVVCSNVFDKTILYPSDPIVFANGTNIADGGRLFIISDLRNIVLHGVSGASYLIFSSNNVSIEDSEIRFLSILTSRNIKVRESYVKNLFVYMGFNISITCCNIVRAIVDTTTSLYMVDNLVLESLDMLLITGVLKGNNIMGKGLRFKGPIPSIYYTFLNTCLINNKVNNRDLVFIRKGCPGYSDSIDIRDKELAGLIVLNVPKVIIYNVTIGSSSRGIFFVYKASLVSLNFSRIYSSNLVIYADTVAIEKTSVSNTTVYVNSGVLSISDSDISYLGDVSRTKIVSLDISWLLTIINNNITISGIINYYNRTYTIVGNKFPILSTQYSSRFINIKSATATISRNTILYNITTIELVDRFTEVQALGPLMSLAVDSMLFYRNKIVSDVSIVATIDYVENLMGNSFWYSLILSQPYRISLIWVNQMNITLDNNVFYQRLHINIRCEIDYIDSFIKNEYLKHIHRPNDYRTSFIISTLHLKKYTPRGTVLLYIDRTNSIIWVESNINTIYSFLTVNDYFYKELALFRSKIFLSIVMRNNSITYKSFLKRFKAGYLISLYTSLLQNNVVDEDRFVQVEFLIKLVLKDNSILGCYIDGGIFSSEQLYDIGNTVVANNTYIDGKPVKVLSVKSGYRLSSIKAIAGNFSQLILYNSYNVTIDFYTFSNAISPLIIVNSINVIVRYNIFSNTLYGVVLKNSSVTIYGNMFLGDSIPVYSIDKSTYSLRSRKGIYYFYNGICYYNSIGNYYDGIECVSPGSNGLCLSKVVADRNDLLYPIDRYQFVYNVDNILWVSGLNETTYLSKGINITMNTVLPLEYEIYLMNYGTSLMLARGNLRFNKTTVVYIDLSNVPSGDYAMIISWISVENASGYRSYRVIVDHEPPIVAFKYIRRVNNGGSSFIAIRYECMDNIGLDKVYYEVIDATSGKVVKRGTLPVSGNLSIRVDTLPPGEYMVLVKAIDKAGNTGLQRYILRVPYSWERYLLLLLLSPVIAVAVYYSWRLYRARKSRGVR